MRAALQQLWIRWKALRLPWRRSWLVGVDLSGNTYWEFRDALRAGRLRRIIKPGRNGGGGVGGRVHHSDVQVSPQWMQWLRHTRADAPTVAEQRGDLDRQARLKTLAAAADRRWEEKQSYLRAPPAAEVARHGGVASARDSAGDEGDGRRGAGSGREEGPVLSERERGLVRELRREATPPAWAARTPPKRQTEEQQPDAWTPSAAPRRR